jgi:hypothetical protein
MKKISEVLPILIRVETKPTAQDKLNEAANGVLFSCTKKEILVTSLILDY